MKQAKLLLSARIPWLYLFLALSTVFFPLKARARDIEVHIHPKDSLSSLIPTDIFSSVMRFLRPSSQPLHIVHIGDSHLQSGYTGESLRETLGEEFLVTGYGLISPYKIAGNNAPASYRYTSPQRWKGCTLSYKRSCNPTPPSCILLERRSAGDFSFEVKSIAYPFDELICFRSPASPPLVPRGKEYHLAKGTAEYSGIVADTLRFEQLEQSITLKPLQTTKEKVAYGGLILLNHGIGKKDLRKQVLYSEVALNGAMFVSYDREEVLEAIVGLHPQLLVVSLGTNEALAKGFRLDAFKCQAEKFLKHLRAVSPHSTILLTSPPPSFQKNGRFNSRTEQISSLLKEIAKRDGYYFFDLYEALGGKTEAKRRKREGGYYNRDGVHFTVAGYHKHGRILGEAIAKLLK